MKKVLLFVSTVAMLGLMGCPSGTEGGGAGAAKKFCKACDNVMTISAANKCLNATSEFQDAISAHQNDEAWLEAAYEELDKCDAGMW